MSRAQSIVDMILSGERFANSHLFDDKVYVDEPIIRTGQDAFGRHGHVARRQRLHVPPAYKEMRRIAQELRRSSASNADFVSKAQIFVLQAQHIEGLEDDFSGTFDPYGYGRSIPTYEDLSNWEMRCYITWRTRFRAGETLDSPMCFLLLHAYEIINGIGKRPSPEGLGELARLADKARNSYAEPRFLQWQQDYVVYYGLDSALLAELPSHGGFEAVHVLRAAEETVLAGGKPADAEALLDALVCLSRYRADRSSFFRERREDVAWVAVHVFVDMVAHCSKRRKTGFVEGLFGKPVRRSYTMFGGVPFWSEKPHGDMVYEVSPSESYACERGFWWRMLPGRHCERSKEVGALLHAIDARMRRACGYKRDLKNRSLPKYQAKFVDARIAELLAMRKAEEEARISIDRSALGSIRSAAARTREALLTDEEREDVGLDQMPVKSNDLLDATLPATQNAALSATPDAPEPRSPQNSVGLALDEGQLDLLRALLDGRRPQSDNGMFVSLAVDAINEVFLDVVGDTVVDFDGDMPVLVEDYEQDVRDALM